MKARIVSLVTVLSTCLVISGPAFAHHSMSMYDRGNIEKWVAEGPGPNRLANHGWSKDSLKPGDEITIVGNRNRDGSPTMRFEKVILPNGQELEARPHFF